MGFWSFLFGKPRDYHLEDLPAYGGSSATLPTRQRQAGVLEIKAGDVVSYDGIDYEVESRYTYDDHGFKWFAYHLVDVVSKTRIWLAAEDDDGLQLGIYQPVSISLPGPIPAEIIHAEETFYEDEHGNATVYIESVNSNPRHSQVEYFDFYNEDDSRFLSIERWGGETEVSLGKPVAEYQLQIFPGDRNA